MIIHPDYRKITCRLEAYVISVCEYVLRCTLCYQTKYIFIMGGGGGEWAFIVTCSQGLYNLKLA